MSTPENAPAPEQADAAPAEAAVPAPEILTGPDPNAPEKRGVVVIAGIFQPNAVVRAYKARNENQLRAEGGEQVGERVVDAEGNVGFSGFEVGDLVFVAGYKEGVYTELRIRAFDFEAPNTQIVQQPPTAAPATLGYANTPPPEQLPVPPETPEGEEPLPVGLPEGLDVTSAPPESNADASATSGVGEAPASEASEEAGTANPAIEPTPELSPTIDSEQEHAVTQPADETSVTQPANETSPPEQAAPEPAGSPPSSEQPEAAQAPATDSAAASEPTGSSTAPQDAAATAPESQPETPPADQPPATP